MQVGDGVDESHQLQVTASAKICKSQFLHKHRQLSEAVPRMDLWIYNGDMSRGE